MTQEAVRNVVRHAGATRVHLQLTRRGAELELRVSDDGQGYDPQVRARRTGSVGLELARPARRRRRAGGSRCRPSRVPAPSWCCRSRRASARPAHGAAADVGRRVIRVLVVDDHPLVRHGLLALLGSVEGVHVVGAVEDGALAADAVVEHDCDVVLMDLSMPGLDGIEATREVLARAPDVKVVVLTSSAEPERIVAALDAGATGYVLKDAEPDDVVRAVRDAAAGHAPLSPRAALALLPGRRPVAPRGPR